MNKLSSILIGFVLGVLIGFSGLAFSAEWSYLTQPVINEEENARTITFSHTLTEGESLQSILTGILQGTWEEGTTRYRVKQVFTRTVPVNKYVDTTMILDFVIRDE